MMRRLAIALLAAHVALLSVSGRVLASPPEMAELWNSPAITWRTMRDGVREATLTGKPVVLVFHASWCTSCRQYREVFKDEAIVEAARDFVMILVDGDKDKVVNGAFAPDGTYVPRTIFLDAEGNIQSQIKGSDPQFPHTVAIDRPDELLSLMRQAKAELIDGKREGTAPDRRASSAP